MKDNDITPLSSGEKEELLDIIQKKSKQLDKEHRKRMYRPEDNRMVDAQHPESKPSSVDTNIEEKKSAPQILYENGIDIMTLNDEFNTSLLKSMEEYATTTPVQEKPDFEKIVTECPEISTHDAFLGCIAGMEYIWKNYVDKQPKV